MYMRRKAYDRLLKWKKGNGESALLVEGARRVGKSYLVKEFGEREYRSCIIVNFSSDRVDPRPVFEKNAGDLDMLFDGLSALYGTRLYRRESLIVFDEIQLYLPAREMIKTLVEDKRYDYIETGSLVSIKTKMSGILIPSEEDGMELHPMDFEEFLWAMGEDQLVEYLRGCFDDLRPVGESIHHKAMRLFRQYMLVGGMPQAVQKYVEMRDFESADTVKRRILKLYREDIANWGDRNTAHILQIFDRIPAELGKESKTFTLASIGKNARMREYEDSFLWLADGKIVGICQNSTDPSVGLSAYSDMSGIKCYMADTGLLITHTYNERGYLDNELYKAILLGNLGINEGMLTENVVAQLLVSNGCRLFYYRRGRNDPKGQMEVDFLIRRGLKISPVEVKSSDDSTHHPSLDSFRRIFRKGMGPSYVLHPKDVSQKDGIIYLPLYMTQFL